MKRKIVAKNQYTTYAAYPLVSGDVRAYEICLDLGKDVPGAEFKVTAIRADGKVIEDIGTVQGGIATYTMAANMYSVTGELTVRLAVLHDSSVLTDREIVFEVLEGAKKTDAAETVVPLNDSVILRLGAIEQKLSDKVDKIEGKDLSANDFTNEYKEKLDCLDETIGKEVERTAEAVLSLSGELGEHKDTCDNPHNVTAVQIGAYTKEEADALINRKTDILQMQLDKKMDKSDVSNVYRYMGSVSSVENLPVIYSFEVGGVPKDETGAAIGTYDEKTGKFTFDYSVTLSDEDEKTITIPLKNPIQLPDGYFASGYIDFGNISVSCGDGLVVDKYVGRIFCYSVPRGFAGDEVQVSEISLILYTDDQTDNCTFSLSGSGKITAGIYKVEQSNDLFAPLEAGNVYNVLESDVNYAWTGKNWDALGGEHKDVEARNQIGNVEDAIDSIIAIQNILIGGNSQ